MLKMKKSMHHLLCYPARLIHSSHCTPSQHHIPAQVPGAFLFNRLVNTFPKAAYTEAEHFENYLDHDVNQSNSFSLVF